MSIYHRAGKDAGTNRLFVRSSDAGWWNHARQFLGFTKVLWADFVAQLEPPLATEHVSPPIKNKILPADCPILMKYGFTSKGFNLLTAPRDDRVCEPIVENGGF